MSGRLKPKASGQPQQPQQPRFQAFGQAETEDGVRLYEEAPVQAKESTNVNQGRGMREDIAVPKMKISKAISSVDNQRQSLGFTEGVEFLDADTKLAFTEEQQAEEDIENEEYARMGGHQMTMSNSFRNGGKPKKKVSLFSKKISEEELREDIKKLNLDTSRPGRSKFQQFSDLKHPILNNQEPNKKTYGFDASKSSIITKSRAKSGKVVKGIDGKQSYISNEDEFKNEKGENVVKGDDGIFRTDAERKEIERRKEEELKKSPKDKVIENVDDIASVMQLGNFVPHPIAQSIGKAGNVIGIGTGLYQTGKAIQEEDYLEAGIDAASLTIPFKLGKESFRRNSKFSKSAKYINEAIGDQGRTSYINIRNQVKGQTTDQLKKNRMLLGANASEIGYNFSNNNEDDKNEEDVKKYESGGNLTEFNEGGTHEESELGGIPQGQAENGQTNLVEEGETKLKDSNYVLSNSLIVNELDADELNLPKDIIGMTFADASKFLNKIAEENGSDHLIMKDVKANLENLTIANEKARINQEELNINQNSDLSSNKMFLGGIIKGIIGGKSGGAGGNTPSVGATEGAEGAAGAVNLATTALDLGQTAFGKSGIDTSGKTDVNPGGVKPGMMGLSGAMKGAQAGAMFGPLGAGIGGAVGLTAGLIGGFKGKKDALKAHQNFEIGQSNMKISNFNLGGILNGDPKKKKEGTKTLTTKEALQESKIIDVSEDLATKPTSDLKGKPVNIDWGVQTKDSRGNYVTGNYIYYKKRGPGYNPDVDREFVSNQNWETVRGTKQFSAYNEDVENERKAAETRRKIANSNPSEPIIKNNSFELGGYANNNPFKEEEHTKGTYGYSGNNFMKDQFLSNLNYAKNKATNTNDELSYISEDELKNDKSGYASDELIPSTDKKFKMKGESPLKYAGLVGAGLNYLEDSKLKAREINLDKIRDRYNPQYVDEASILNNVRNESNSQIRMLSELGLSRGQMISNINAMGLNKAKATSDAMQKAQDINRNENRTAQEFNNRNDIFNIGQSNQETELNQREQDAVADRKRMSRDALFLSAGELGKEQTYKNRLYNLTGGYDTQGVFKAADGKQYIQNEEGILVAIPNQEEKKNGGLLSKYDKYLSNKKSEREMYINILKGN